MMHSQMRPDPERDGVYRLHICEHRECLGRTDERHRRPEPLLTTHQEIQIDVATVSRAVIADDAVDIEITGYESSRVLYRLVPYGVMPDPDVAARALHPRRSTAGIADLIDRLRKRRGYTARFREADKS